MKGFEKQTPLLKKGSPHILVVSLNWKQYLAFFPSQM